MSQISAYKQKWFDFMDYKPHYGQKKLHFLHLEEIPTIIETGLKKMVLNLIEVPENGQFMICL